MAAINKLKCDLDLGDSKPHVTKKLLRDPLNRMQRDSEEVMRLCKACYQKAKSESDQQAGKECDLKGTDDAPHKIVSGGVILDPLKRKKRDSEEVIRLCKACYQKAKGELDQQAGKECDLKGRAEGAHEIASWGLHLDPLKRTKIDSEEVMRLCLMCYRKAKGELDQQAGKECDLKATGDGEHNISSSGLKLDPLKRRKIDSEEVMRVCMACYRKAKGELDQQSGKECDLKGSGEGAHNIASGGLHLDPLKRRKIDSDEVMRVCLACYQKARREFNANLGKECNLKATGDGEHNISSSGLKSDSLKRKKRDSEEVMNLSKRSYQKEKEELNQQLSKECDLKGTVEGAHTITSGLLMGDPLKRKKRDSDEIMRLCKACFYKAKADFEVQSGKECDLKESVEGLHTITSGGLVADPLARKKKDSQEIMRLCKSCLLKARAELDIQAGNQCDLKGSVQGDHKIVSGGLHSDPLKRMKRDSDEIMRLCNSCYRKTLKQAKESQNQASAGGNLSEVAIAAEEAHSSDQVCSSPKDLSDEQIRLLVKREEEPQYPFDPECQFLKRARVEHTIHNSLPILQNPSNVSASMQTFSESELDKMRMYRWGVFQSASKKDKESMILQMKEWIRINQEDKQEYEKRLGNSLEVSVPIDEGPSRGRSVFAKEDIEPYTVIGPYAGKLHETEESLLDSIYKNGSYHVLGYLFATSSSKKSIDAFGSGNIISLINTGQLSDEDPTWKENNVGSVVFGQNLIFVVSSKKIRKGEELLLDYGPNYNPMQMIKVEEESEDELYLTL